MKPPTKRQRETLERAEAAAGALHAQLGGGDAGVIIIAYRSLEDLAVASAPLLQRAEMRAVLAEAITRSLLADGVALDAVGDAAERDYEAVSKRWR
jgi:hypothetical protein